MYLVFEFQKFGKNLKHFSKAKNLSKNLLFLRCEDLAPVFLSNVSSFYFLLLFYIEITFVILFTCFEIKYLLITKAIVLALCYY